MIVSDEEAAKILRRQLRIMAILAGAESVGLSPVSSRQLHVFGYFTDALAPVWGLRILDVRLLKLQEGPTSSELQHDVDRLVGRGVVAVSDVSHSVDSDGLWRLDANYALNSAFGAPILDQARLFNEFADEIAYTREVVYALSGLGQAGLAHAPSFDASYGDELVDSGDMVNLEAGDRGDNLTAQVADRFEEVVPPGITITDAEKVHLYIRELYSRFHNDA